MTDPRGSEERLVDAFRSPEPDGAEVPDEMRDRIWLAVSGALSAEERRDVVDLTASDPAYAEAWRIARDMWEASQAAGAAGAAATAAPSPRRWAPGWLAAAAAVVLGAALGVMTLVNRTPGDEYRSAAEYRIGSLVPDNALLDRGGLVLRWTPGPDGTRYAVRVTTPDLQMLTFVTNLEAPELALTPATFDEVAPGGPVLWQVDATLPDGGRVMSDTFTIRVQ